MKPLTARRPPPDDDLVERREILDETGIRDALVRIATAIGDRNRSQPIALVGIRTGGLFLAERLARLLSASAGPVLSPQMIITASRNAVDDRFRMVTGASLTEPRGS